MKIALVVSVFLVCWALAQPNAGNNSTGVTDAPVEPAPPVATDEPESGFCSFTLANGRKFFLSKTRKFETKACHDLGQGLKLAMLKGAYEATEALGGSIDESMAFAAPNPNRTVACNLTVMNLSIPFPLVTDQNECHLLNHYVQLTGEAAAYAHLTTLRRAMQLDDEDGEEGSGTGARQSAKLATPLPCEVGPYGLSIKHWIKADCEVAKSTYARCVARQAEGTGTRAILVKCFADAVAHVEST